MENILGILDNVKAAVTDQAFTTEVIVVDDKVMTGLTVSAPHGGDANSDEPPVRAISRSLQRGYGAVVRYGAALGTGRYCIFVSADAVAPTHLIPALYSEMKRDAVPVHYSRYIQTGDDGTISFKYKFYQLFFRIVVRKAVGQYITDSTYASMMSRRREMLGSGRSQNRFSISPEISFKSILTGGYVKYIAGAQGVREVLYSVAKIFQKVGFAEMNPACAIFNVGHGQGGRSYEFFSGGKFCV